MKIGDVEEAKSIYSDILSRFPKNRRAMHGLKSITGGQFQNSSSFENPSQSVINEVVQLYIRGLFQDALDRVSALIEEISQIGHLEESDRSDPGEAPRLRSSEKKLPVGSTAKSLFYEPYNNLANLKKRLGSTKSAVLDYKRALIINSSYADAYFNLGIVEEEQSDKQNANEYYERVLKLDQTM